MFFLNYKQKAEKNKNKIIKRDVKAMKTQCIREFRKSIKKGFELTYVDFCFIVTRDFESEISDIVLKELQQEHKDIEFSFSWRHCNNSYKGIKMIAL